MGDTKIVYDEKFGIATFKREICAELGETFWNELVKILSYLTWTPSVNVNAIICICL